MLIINVKDIPGTDPRSKMERAIKIYSNKVKSTKLLEQVREKQYYVKPSDRKRKLRNDAIRRQRWEQNND